MWSPSCLLSIVPPIPLEPACDFFPLSPPCPSCHPALIAPVPWMPHRSESIPHPRQVQIPRFSALVCEPPTPLASAVGVLCGTGKQVCWRAQTPQPHFSQCLSLCSGAVGPAAICGNRVGCQCNGQCPAGSYATFSQFSCNSLLQLRKMSIIISFSTPNSVPSVISFKVMTTASHVADSLMRLPLSVLPPGATFYLGPPPSFSV